VSFKHFFGEREKMKEEEGKGREKRRHVRSSSFARSLFFLQYRRALEPWRSSGTWQVFLPLSAQEEFVGAMEGRTIFHLLLCMSERFLLSSSPVDTFLFPSPTRRAEPIFFIPSS